MPIRLEQSFTLPREIKYLTRSNLKTLYPYFHRRIIDSDKKIHNNLNENCLNTDVRLKELCDELEIILANKPFEAYCIIHTDNEEKISKGGLRIPATSTFVRTCLKRLKATGFPKEKLNEAKVLLDEFQGPFVMDFFMPADSDYLCFGKQLYIDNSSMKAVFSNKLPEALDYLNKYKNAYLVRCIIRYKNFCEDDKNRFKIELLKHFTYQLMTDYDYPLVFHSTTSQNIPKSRVLEVTPIIRNSR